jgi:uracil phosphoribosyltransferase
MLLLYEALRDLKVRHEDVETPLEVTKGARLVDEIVVIAILRAGLGMVESALRLVPEARVGHLGIYRDEKVLKPVGYYESIPEAITNSEVVIVDPMLATGGSAVHAITRLKSEQAKRVHFVCVLAAPEGIAVVREAHPDVQVTCAAIDDGLTENAYIRPGLGDAGDRLFGTE